MSLRTLVDATDLARWAERRDAQGRLPQLLRRLVHATLERIGRIGFPAGEGVQLGGWDGVVVTNQGNAFVPEAQSVWELGVNRDVKGKADDDYEKRKQNPLGLNPGDTTYIFVTPRRWGGKDKWIAERQSEGIWREVRAYDADDLEQWLEQAPAVHVWLSILLGKHPDTAVDLESFWSDWSQTTNPSMLPRLLTSGRTDAVAQVQSWLTGEPRSITIKADTRDEAIAFLAAVLHELSPDDRIPLLARSLMVIDQAAWNQLAASDQALLLVPAFEVGNGIIRALRGGHHVFVPLGRNSSVSESTVELPRLRRAQAREALIAMGINEERADDLATIGRRSLMALRRKLAIRPEVQQPAWAQPAEARALLPALLTGGWSDVQAGDREVVAQLARAPYEDVSAMMTRWANEPDAPVRRVGDTWLLLSKEDAWLLLSRFLTRDDFDVFSIVVLDVLGAVDPSYNLPPEQRMYARVRGLSLKHSGLLRSGLCETLAIMAARSHTTQFADSSSGKEHARRVVRNLMGRANSDWRIWASISYHLPLLAEAAPQELLEAVNSGLSDPAPFLVNLFTAEGDDLFDSSPHTGLLWALEVLAWSPDYIAFSSLMLAKLAWLDPGGRLANRPGKSLRDIFLLWRPHTSASLEHRLQAIDFIREREPEIGWSLLCSLLPEYHSSTSPTASPRWRDWMPEEQPEDVDPNYWSAVAGVTQRLLDSVGVDGQRWRQLIEQADSFPQQQHDALVSMLLSADITRFARSDKTIIWDALRALISKHRQFPDAEWAMPDELVDRLVQAYECFEPDDLVTRFTWLFAETPHLLQPVERDWKQEDRTLLEARLEAVHAWYEAHGLPMVLAAADQVENPTALGEVLCESGCANADEDTFLRNELGSPAYPRQRLVWGYVTWCVATKGWEWIAAKLASTPAAEWSVEQRAEFLRCMPFGAKTWDYVARDTIDVQRIYWSCVQTFHLVDIADCERAVLKLFEYGRPYDAVNVIRRATYRDADAVTPQTIAEVLEQTLQTAPPQHINWSSVAHNIGNLLDLLDQSGTVDEAILAKLEFGFLPVLKRQRPAKQLHCEMARNPKFFMEIITLVYRAEGEEPRQISDEEQLRAELAYELLGSWRVTPGSNQGDVIDATELNNWVDQVRASAADLGRRKVADLAIGQVLRFLPQEEDGSWPCSIVRNLIERLASEEIERGVALSVYNTRGTVMKSIAEGGDQERQLVGTYQAYAHLASSRWPRTAAMLRDIADTYVSEARREDIRAELEEDLWR